MSLGVAVGEEAILAQAFFLLDLSMIVQLCQVWLRLAGLQTYRKLSKPKSSNGVKIWGQFACKSCWTRSISKRLWSSQE